MLAAAAHMDACGTDDNMLADVTAKTRKQARRAAGRDTFSAADSALGLIFQCRYALLLLLQQNRPDAQLSIEHLDDIAFERDGTPLELIQTKYRVKSLGDLTDTSPDLW